jgi:hypothetical protein
MPLFVFRASDNQDVELRVQADDEDSARDKADNFIMDTFDASDLTVEQV